MCANAQLIWAYRCGRSSTRTFLGCLTCSTRRSAAVRPAGGRRSSSPGSTSTTPSGRSLLLVAEHDDRLIGLRAFMRWRLAAGDRDLTAVRAVDTATHPDFQGMGVFSKLTRAALDAGSGQVDLVFNTPNGKSGPGYLKMGWREVGRVPVAVRVRRPLRLLTSRRARPGGPAPAAAGGGRPGGRRPGGRGDAGRRRCSAREPDRRPGWPPPATSSYLRWRYGAAPLLGYRGVAEERGGELTGLALFRVRPRGGLWESTVAEVLAGGDPATARRLLRQVAAAAAGRPPHPARPRRLPGWPGRPRRAGFLPSPAGIRLVANPLRRRHRARPDQPRRLGAVARRPRGVLSDGRRATGRPVRVQGRRRDRRRACSASPSPCSACCS